MIVADNLELACGGCGKENYGGAGKKELIEISLHMLKVHLPKASVPCLLPNLKVVVMNKSSKLLSFITLLNVINFIIFKKTRV